MSDAGYGIDFETVSAETCSLNFHFVDVVRSPVNGESSFAKPPRFDHEERPSSESDSENGVKRQSGDPEDETDDGREEERFEVETEESEVECDSSS